MRSIYLHAEVPTGDTDLVFEHIIDFMNYPTVSPDVRSVTTHSAPAAGQARHTDWEVNFRRGIMRWTEREDIDHERWNVTFQQIDGDFDDFRGSWQLTPSPSGCRVELRVTYDFGIESLAKIMDPLAERVIKRAICSVLVDIVGEVNVLEGGAALTDLGELPNDSGIHILTGATDGHGESF
jgi:ribosome-associated toxin RatA of RatAB toxin-antitoxin module